MVYEKYPKTKKEFTCWQERLRLNQLREAFRKRLYDEARKAEIFGSVQPSTQEV